MNEKKRTRRVLEPASVLDPRRTIVPDGLPERFDERGSFSAAERELVRVHVREQARVLAGLARWRARELLHGRVAALYASRSGRAWLARAAIERTYARRDDAPIARVLARSAERDTDALELASEAVRLHAGVEERWTHALVELCAGRVAEARSTCRALLFTVARPRWRARAAVLAGLALLIEGDRRGAATHLRGAIACDDGEPVARELALRLSCDDGALARLLVPARHAPSAARARAERVRVACERLFRALAAREEA